jgi:hypothetical protein
MLWGVYPSQPPPLITPLISNAKLLYYTFEYIPHDEIIDLTLSVSFFFFNTVINVHIIFNVNICNHGCLYSYR